ncbi:hypothetical protein [Leclercia adecarboxylata]|uniref:hypothetical protein n=1 Tax=Leclercia adecarboxylata TaxID=83655 RepID=UPI003015F376
MLFYKKGFVFNGFHMWIYKSKYLYNFSIARRKENRFFKEALIYGLLPFVIGYLLSGASYLDKHGSYMNLYSDIKFYLACAFMSFTFFVSLKLRFESFFATIENRKSYSSSELLYKNKVNNGLSKLKLAISFAYLFPAIFLSIPCLCELATKAIN